MAIEVRTAELLVAAERLRLIGQRVASYSHRMDGRVAHAAGALDDEVAGSLSTAWHEVGRALETLARGFDIYGTAVADVAQRYAEAERDLTIRRPR